MRVLVGDHLSQLDENFRENFGVVAGAVMVKIAVAEMLGHIIELMLFKLGQHFLRHNYRIERGKREIYPRALCGCSDKSAVEISVMRDKQGFAAAKFLKAFEHLALVACVFKHIVSYACKPCDELGKLAVGVAEL